MSLVVSGLTAYVNEQEFPLVGKIQVSPEMTAAGVTIKKGHQRFNAFTLR